MHRNRNLMEVSQPHNTLTKDIKGDLQKWWEIPHSWLRRLNIFKMSLLSRLIYKLNVNLTKILTGCFCFVFRKGSFKNTSGGVQGWKEPRHLCRLGDQLRGLALLMALSGLPHSVEWKDEASELRTLPRSPHSLLPNFHLPSLSSKLIPAGPSPKFKCLPPGSPRCPGRPLPHTTCKYPK